MSDDYNENSTGTSGGSDSSPSDDIYTEGKDQEPVQSAGTEGSDDYYQYRNSSSGRDSYGSSSSSDSSYSGNSYSDNSSYSGSSSYSGNSSHSDTGNSGYGYGSYGSSNSGYSSYPGGGSGYYDGGNNGGSKKPKKKKHSTAFAIVLALIIGIGAGAGAYGISAAVGSGAVRSLLGGSGSSGNNSVASGSSDNKSSGDSSDSSSTESAAEAEEKAGIIKGSSTTEETDVTGVVETVMPSMVSVYNKYTEQTDYFGQSYSQEEESTGSGIIIGQTDDELLIVTNNHVVADADELHVQFTDETQAEANIKGTDSTNDLAVIAVSKDDIKSDTLSSLKVATLGDSDSLKLGEECVAIGNALGYGQSVTVGYISALDREVQSDDGTVNGTFIQTDAAINPGNSGGALCNLSGQVIGINSSKIGGNSVEGMGFAIPISRAEPIITDLMNETTKTKVDEDKQGTLGISGVTVTSSVASAYGMPQGVYVSQIIDGGGAASSDLEVGDIITAIDGTSINSMESLQRALQYYEAGTEVTLTVERQSSSGYKEQSVKLTLGDQDSIKNAQSSNGNSSGSGSTQGSSSRQGGSSGFGSGSIFGY